MSETESLICPNCGRPNCGCIGLRSVQCPRCKKMVGPGAHTCQPAKEKEE